MSLFFSDSPETQNFSSTDKCFCPHSFAQGGWPPGESQVDEEMTGFPDLESGVYK